MTAYRRPQLQALWCTHRLWQDWQRHLVWWRTTWRWRQHKRRSRDRRHTRQWHERLQCIIYTTWLYRVCDMLSPAFSWGLHKRRGCPVCRTDIQMILSFLTFSWDTWTVHLQVDLDEFGVADFVPISTRFCMLSVCYCIILHAGCFLRTFLVLIFLHCCMFYNDWRTMSFRFFAASAFHNSWSRVFHPRMMVPRFPVPRFQSPRSFVTDNIFEVGW